MNRIKLVLATVALCSCGDREQPTQPNAVQPVASIEYDNSQLPSFDVNALPSLGGTSGGNAINNRNWIAGGSNLADGNTVHAALWQDGSVTDLGTLGGPNSSVLWPGINEDGFVVGVAETADMDPNHEHWSCSAFFPTVTFHICRGFVWRHGAMTPLPTLGGNNSFATGVNNRGEVVGWAETPVHDPTCNTDRQVLQFRAVVWEPRRGMMKQLRPYPGDSTSAATAINNRGQVVGISGACDMAVGRFSARHAVLWENGRVIKLGSFGGVAWNTPMAISESGEVVGFADTTGDSDGSFNARAFLWTKRGGIRDLGTLGTDQTSQALGINSRHQIVGTSCGAVACRAFLWSDRKMLNLNKLISPQSQDSLIAAQEINDAGVITGQMFDKSTGKTLAFIARPKHDR